MNVLIVGSVYFVVWAFVGIVMITQGNPIGWVMVAIAIVLGLVALVLNQQKQKTFDKEGK